MGASSLGSGGIPGPWRRAAARLRRRHLLFPCILAVQALMLALFFLNPMAIEALPAAAPPISMFNVSPSAADKPAQPAPQPEPVPVEMPPPEIDLELETLALPAKPVFSESAAKSAGFGTTCDVAETLARAFTENALVKQELARIGPESRSISNAIMFWNARWVELPGNAPKDAVETLRRAIVEGVLAAPDECLTQDLAGPRMITVSDNGSTMVLVLGSGAWRWEQLLNEGEGAPEVPRLAQQGRKD